MRWSILSNAVSRVHQAFSRTVRAYQYLLKCNNHSHFQTWRQCYRTLWEYYGHKNLHCAIQKIEKHTYQIEYLIGYTNHTIVVKMPRGPLQSQQSPEILRND